MPSGPAVEEEYCNVTFDISQKSTTHLSITCKVPVSVAQKGDDAVARWLKRNDWKDDEQEVTETTYGSYDFKTLHVTYNEKAP